MPIVRRELLQWTTAPGSGRPRAILDFKDGNDATYNEQTAEQTAESLANPDSLDPDPPPVIGIEEPENQLHPKLLPLLAEQARQASMASQLLVTTHSPEFVDEFVDAVRPGELWSIGRAGDGFAVVARAGDDPTVAAMVEAGATLGDLWRGGYIGQNPVAPDEVSV